MQLPDEVTTAQETGPQHALQQPDDSAPQPTLPQVESREPTGTASPAPVVADPNTSLVAVTHPMTVDSPAQDQDDIQQRHDDDDDATAGQQTMQQDEPQAQHREGDDVTPVSHEAETEHQEQLPQDPGPPQPEIVTETEAQQPQPQSPQTIPQVPQQAPATGKLSTEPPLERQEQEQLRETPVRPEQQEEPIIAKQQTIEQNQEPKGQQRAVQTPSRRDALVTMKKSIEELYAKVATREQMLAASDKVNGELKKELERKQVALKNASTSNHRLKDQVHDLVAANAQLTAKLSELEAANQHLQQEKLTLEESERLTTRKQLQQQQLLTERTGDLNKLREDSNVKLSALETENLAHITHISQVESEFENTKDKLVACEKENQALATRIDILTSDLDTNNRAAKRSQEAFTSLEEQLHKLENEISKMDSQSEIYQTAYEKSKRDHLEAVSVSNAMIEDILGENRTLKDQIEHITLSVGDRIKEAVAQISKSSSDSNIVEIMGGIISQSERYSAELQVERQKRLDLETHYHYVCQQLSEVEPQIQQKFQEFTELQARMTLLTASEEKSHADSHVLALEKDILQQELSQQKSENLHLKTFISSLTDSKESNTLPQLIEQLSILKTELELAVTSPVPKINQGLLEQINYYRELQQRTEQASVTADRELQEYKKLYAITSEQLRKCGKVPPHPTAEPDWSALYHRLQLDFEQYKKKTSETEALAASEHANIVANTENMQKTLESALLELTVTREKYKSVVLQCEQLQEKVVNCNNNILSLETTICHLTHLNRKQMTDLQIARNELQSSHVLIEEITESNSLTKRYILEHAKAELDLMSQVRMFSQKYNGLWAIHQAFKRGWASEKEALQAQCTLAELNRKILPREVADLISKTEEALFAQIAKPDSPVELQDCIQRIKQLEAENTVIREQVSQVTSTYPSIINNLNTKITSLEQELELSKQALPDVRPLTLCPVDRVSWEEYLKKPLVPHLTPPVKVVIQQFKCNCLRDESLKPVCRHMESDLAKKLSETVKEYQKLQAENDQIKQQLYLNSTATTIDTRLQEFFHSHTDFSSERHLMADLVKLYKSLYDSQLCALFSEACKLRKKYLHEAMAVAMRTLTCSPLPVCDCSKNLSTFETMKNKMKELSEETCSLKSEKEEYREQAERAQQHIRLLDDTIARLQSELSGVRGERDVFASNSKQLDQIGEILVHGENGPYKQLQGMVTALKDELLLSVQETADKQKRVDEIEHTLQQTIEENSTLKDSYEMIIESLKRERDSLAAEKPRRVSIVKVPHDASKDLPPAAPIQPSGLEATTLGDLSPPAQITASVPSKRGTTPPDTSQPAANKRLRTSTSPHQESPQLPGPPQVEGSTTTEHPTQPNPEQSKPEAQSEVPVSVPVPVPAPAPVPQHVEHSSTGDSEQTPSHDSELQPVEIEQQQPQQSHPQQQQPPRPHPQPQQRQQIPGKIRRPGAPPSTQQPQTSTQAQTGTAPRTAILTRRGGARGRGSVRQLPTGQP
ncbi:hypothetical protein Pelo_12071 [Pelomyxa schiedti]|nr:hypothetical protein Pelo_12071 [Pelomyxa schiedti]